MIPKKGQSPVLKIVQRHHFSSALKRMSVVAGYTMPGSSEINYMTTVKGAPEIIKNMVRSKFRVIYFALIMDHKYFNFFSSCHLFQTIMIRHICHFHDAEPEY